MPDHLGQLGNWEALVEAELQDSLTPLGIQQWMVARNRYLGGGRPCDLIARGDGECALEAATAFSEGVYL